MARLGFIRTNYEVFAALIVNLCLIPAGVALTWSSSAIINFKKDDPKENPLGKRISIGEQSWIGSCLTLGALIGPLLACFFAEKLGRKFSIIIGCFLFVTASAVLLSPQSMAQVLSGRVIQGVGVGMEITVVSIYIAEISSKDLRGALGSCVQIFLNIGILMYSVLEMFTSYIVCQSISLILPVIGGIIIVISMPESPHFLVSKGRTEEAIQSLMLLKGGKTEKDVKEDLEEVINTINVARKRKGLFADLYQVKGIRRALFICVGQIFFQQCSGIYAVLFYTKSILKHSGVQDLDLGVGISFLCMTLSSFLTPILAMFFGRRHLVLTSISATSFILSVFALHCYWSEVKSHFILEKTHWVPVTSITLFLMFFCVGMGPMPWVILGEMFPAYIKPLATTLIASMHWLFACFISFIYPVFESSLGISIVFYTFALIGLAGIFFTMITMIETRGLTLWQIQMALISDTRH